MAKLHLVNLAILSFLIFANVFHWSEPAFYFLDRNSGKKVELTALVAQHAREDAKKYPEVIENGLEMAKAVFKNRVSYILSFEH
jgi:hypothetical protein